MHIDFGFILGIMPGGAFSLEKDGPFKLTAEMVDLMGGLESPNYQTFRQLFLDGMRAVRREYVKVRATQRSIMGMRCLCRVLTACMIVRSQLLSLLHLTVADSPFPCFQSQSPGSCCSDALLAPLAAYGACRDSHLLRSHTLDRRCAPHLSPPTVPRTQRRRRIDAHPAPRGQELQQLGHAAVRQVPALDERHPALTSPPHAYKRSHSLISSYSLVLSCAQQPQSPSPSERVPKSLRASSRPAAAFLLTRALSLLLHDCAVAVATASLCTTNAH